MALGEGQHLGYYCGIRARKWVARYRQPGHLSRYQEITIAEADDYADADGSKILSLQQAQELACKWFAPIGQSDGRNPKPYLVSDALDDYLKGFAGKDLENTRRRIDAIIRPQIGRHDTAMLKTRTIMDWHFAMANAPARRRTAPGAIQTTA